MMSLVESSVRVCVLLLLCACYTRTDNTTTATLVTGLLQMESVMTEQSEGLQLHHGSEGAGGQVEVGAGRQMQGGAGGPRSRGLRESEPVTIKHYFKRRRGHTEDEDRSSNSIARMFSVMARYRDVTEEMRASEENSIRLAAESAKRRRDNLQYYSKWNTNKGRHKSGLLCYFKLCSYATY